MSSGESAGFERGDEYLQAPSPKRVRFDHSNGEAPEVIQVSQVVETVPTEDPNEVDTVTITVPSSQFEIEINSQVEEEEDVEEQVPQISRSDLTGPAFGIVENPQELPSLGESSQQRDEGGTLNAIGRALLQMQQGSQQTQIPASSNQQQIFLTRASSTSEPDAGSQNAPLYVMIPPASSAEILQAMGQSRPIAPKVTSSPPPLSLHITPDDSGVVGGDVKTREAQRKATHNEVERRRRDRINELIKMLAMIVPGCQKKDATTGTIVGYVYSKGTVLDKTVEYLKELISQNEQLAGTAKLAEKSANALSLLQNQITVLEKENAFLRAQIIQFGIDAAASSSQPSATANRQLLNTPLAQSLLNTVAQASQQTTAPAPQAPPPAPTPPPPLPQNVVGANSQAAAQQLLISLAQSLTNSPLLTTPTQTPPPVVTTSPSHLSSSLSVTSTPTRLPPVQSVSPVASHQSQGAPGTNPSLMQPLLTSLVQTLASLANTNTATPVPKASPTLQPQTPPQPPPPPPAGGGGGLSAAAAASLLNTLIMAQNVLTNTSSGGGVASGQGVSESVLTSMGLEAVSRGEQ